MKAVLHIDLDDETCEYILSKLRKQGENVKSQSNLVDKCDKCGKSVAKVVVDFCKNHTDRFGDNVYCRDCQGEY